MAGVKHLYQLIYASASKGQYSREDLEKILTVSRKNNEKLGVTGILLYHDGSILQVLEGEKETVEYLFATISKDSRHTQVMRLWAGPTREREFKDWTMGFAHITSEEIETVPGLNDFFMDGNSILELSEGKARRLVGTFAKVSGARQLIG